MAGMMFRSIVPIVSLTLLGTASAGDRQVLPGDPWVGDPAPPLPVARLLQAPPEAQPTWEALRGRVVVVEFWATWCPPCVQALPHLNGLAGAFEERDVVFISITAEDAKTVSGFVGQHPIKGWIGIEADQAMTRKYGSFGIPETVVVNRTGQIAAFLHPLELNEQLLQEVLDGGFPAGPTVTVETVLRPVEESIQLVRPWRRPGELRLAGPALDIVVHAYRVPPVRIIQEVELPPGFHEVRVSGPPEHAPRLRTLLRGTLETGWGFEAVREERKVEVIVLRSSGELAGALRKSREQSVGRGSATRSMTRNERGISMTEMPFSFFVRELERLIDRPVIDETGLTGRFDATVDLGSRGSRTDVEALRDQTGLVIEQATRSVKFLVLRSAQPTPIR